MWQRHEHDMHFVYKEEDFVNYDPSRSLLGAIIDVLRLSAPAFYGLHMA